MTNHAGAKPTKTSYLVDQLVNARAAHRKATDFAARLELSEHVATAERLLVARIQRDHDVDRGEARKMVAYMVVEAMI